MKFTPIGRVISPYQSKFAVPRQPGLVRGSTGIIKLKADPHLQTALKCLDGFSHLWVIFVFHAHGAKDWKPSVRPPRLGGKTKVGVLASRSPHRPNPIGLSAVAIERIEVGAQGGAEIHIRGHDLLDGTPVLDIKPYLPYADSIPEARAGWAAEAIPSFSVKFSESAKEQIRQRDPDGAQSLQKLIIEVLELDPRPAFQQRKFPASSAHAEGLCYGFSFLNLDIRYEIRNGGFWVFDILDLPSDGPASN